MTNAPAKSGGWPGRTGMSDAILREIAQLLASFLETGESGAIDLRGMPLTDFDRIELEARLGQGEVSAIITVAGTSEIWETAISGVWWVRHRGEGDRIASEEIVVTRIPKILATHVDDARDGLARLLTLLEKATMDSNDPQSARPTEWQEER